MYDATAEFDAEYGEIEREGCEIQCPYEACTDCLTQESQGLWIHYYEQYREAVLCLLEATQAKDHVLPLLNLVATYIELWIKAIGLNYGLGSDRAVKAELYTGHNLEELMVKMRDSIRWSEYTLIKESFFRVWDIIDYISGLSAEKDISLSEAMRYPERKNRTLSINRCLIAFLYGECDKFQIDDILEQLKELMDLTYEIYDAIYDARLMQEDREN